MIFLRMGKDLLQQPEVGRLIQPIFPFLREVGLRSVDWIAIG